jgi:hypothetical protein
MLATSLVVVDVRPIRSDQSEHLAKDQIQQPQRHGGDHPGALAAPITAGQRQVRRSGTRQVIPAMPATWRRRVGWGRWVRC